MTHRSSSRSRPPPVPLRFIDAARHLQDSFAGAASPTSLEDGRHVVQALAGHLDSSVTIAASVCDLIENGELRAPARAVARLLAERNEGSDRLLATPIDPLALARRMTIPLDADMRAFLSASSTEVFENAHETVRRSSGLDMAYRTTADGAWGPDAARSSKSRNPMRASRVPDAKTSAPSL